MAAMKTLFIIITMRTYGAPHLEMRPKRFMIMNNNKRYVEIYSHTADTYNKNCCIHEREHTRAHTHTHTHTIY